MANVVFAGSHHWTTGAAASLSSEFRKTNDLAARRLINMEISYSGVRPCAGSDLKL